MTQSSPPQPLAESPFEISQPYETRLANGLRVVVFENERLPLVSYRLAFFSGDVNDDVRHRGLTTAMTSLITEGTANYSSLQLAEKVERLGAGLSASASYDFTTVSASSLSFYTSAILEMMSEVALRPSFPENEIDLYRRNTIENLKFQRSQPPFLATEQAARLIYGDHPYSHVAPSPADIEKIDRDRLRRLHRERMVPANALLLIVGDVDRDVVTAEIEQHFGDWNGTPAEAASFPEPPTRDTRTLTIVDRPGSAQSNIVIGNLGVSRTHPDYFSLLVMNQILGAGASSRVFMNLREEKGYTYGAYTRFDAKRLAGDFEATAEVRNEVTGDSLKEFFYEFERIRSEKVADAELDDAKSFLKGVFPIRAETQEGLTNLLLNQLLYDLPADYLQTYREKVAAVTTDDVLDAAQKYVRPDEMAIVVVGDAAAIRSQAEPWAGSVEVFDTDGKPV